MQELPQENGPEYSNLFNVTIEGFKDLQEAGLDMNTLFILECFSEGTDITKHIQSSKIEAWKQNLIRNDYISDGFILTKKGTEVLSSLKRGRLPAQEAKIKEQEAKSAFDIWWAAYPPTDNFIHEGKRFSGSRGFRVKKDECKKKFLKIVESGEHTAEEMVEALKVEVSMKKEASIRDGANKLSYMNNSLTYLNQCVYENFIDIAKTYTTPTSKGSGAVDI